MRISRLRQGLEQRTVFSPVERCSAFDSEPFRQPCLRVQYTINKINDLPLLSSKLGQRDQSPSPITELTLTLILAVPF